MFEQLNHFIEKSETIREACLNPPRYSTFEEIILFVSLIILLIVVWAGLTIILTGGLSPGTDEYTLMSLFSFIATIILAILYVTVMEKRSLRSMGLSRDNVASSVLKGLAIGFLVFVSIIVVGVVLDQYAYTGTDFASLYLAIPYLVVFTIQSFGEELYTRGWMMTSLSRNHSVFTAVLISSLFFTLLHLGNGGIDFLSVVNLFLMSTVFSVMFLRFDNVWICGAFHTVWNYIQGYLLGFNVSGITTSSLIQFNQVSYSLIGGSGFGPESGLITTVIAIIVLLALILYPRKSVN